jgi:hypothetical protein
MNHRDVFVKAVVFAFLFPAVSPVAAQTPVPTGSRLIFPHIADGSENNGTWETDFIFVSSSSTTATGQLSLFDDTGSPLSLATNQGTANSFNITIPPKGQFEVQTLGSRPLGAGWAQANFDTAVVGTAVFSFLNSLGKVVSVGVLAQASPESAFFAPAETDTGIAIANTSTSSNMIAVDLYDPSGSDILTTNVSLGANQHAAYNLISLFPALSSTFRGTVVLHSTSNPKVNFNALVIAFEPNTAFTGGFVGFSVQTVAPPAGGGGGASGTFQLLNVVDHGTFSLSNTDSLTSNMFIGTITFVDQTNSVTYSGPFLATTDDSTIFYDFYFQLSGLPSPGYAVALKQSSTITGFVADMGNGNYGRFSIP